MSTTPYQFISRGNLFITPVGPSISEAPYPTQSFTKPREFSLWVRGKVEEPEFQLDQARMPPSMYQEVRKDLSKYSSVPVSRSAFRRSQHAYVGVIDSLGKPYYFALDSRGFSCREAPVNDDRVWKTFDQLAGEEQLMAIKQRRHAADEEMEQVDRELSEPLLVISKGLKKAKVKIEQWPLLHGSSTSTTVRMPKEKKERFLAAIGKRGGKPPSPSHLTRVTEHGYDTHNAQGERIKKPSLYQRARGLLGKPRTDITEEGHPTKPQLPAARVVRQLGSGKKVEKALPKKSKEEPVKKPKPASGASKKQMGAGGKTRYTYLQEGKAKLPKPTPLVVALPQETRQNVDPTELANQLGVSKLTLTKIASKLGRKGFSRYMRSHLKRFAAKHRLGHDYWDQIYGTVVQTSVQNEEKTFGSP